MVQRDVTFTVGYIRSWQGSFYGSQHELVFVYKNGEAPHTNNFELGQHGRNRSNVWTYAGVNFDNA